MMSTLIRGGMVVTEDDVHDSWDILIRDSRISKIGPSPLPDYADTIIDARGKLIFPGGIDSHVHLEYPQGGNKIYSADDFLSGSVAGLFFRHAGMC